MRRALLLAAGVLALSATVFFLARCGHRPERGVVVPPAPPTAVASAPAAKAGGLAEGLKSLLAKFRDSSGTPADLAALREAVRAADPREAMVAITEFLKSGQDWRTGEAFTVGPGGLSGAPTLRVLLMDLLGQLARETGSGAADAVARSTLEAKTSPEEWAISLRNVAWSEPNATGFLSAKMHEMLAEPAWTAAPSAGLLEAFDVIAYAGDPGFIDQLSALARGDSSALGRAALVAMDRLSERAPLAVMEYLNANPALLGERPMLRADYFAKADLSQPAQQTAIETYLGRADVGVAEKTKLLQALATPASFVSDNLLTPPPVPGDDAARQRTLGTVLGGWLQANRFPELAGVIAQVRGEISN